MMPLRSLITATTHIVPNSLKKPSLPAFVVKVDKIMSLPSTVLPTSTTSVRIPQTALRVSTFLTAPLQVRFAHTDIRVPDFTPYRRESTKDPERPATETSDSRRMFNYLIVGASSVPVVYGAKYMVNMFVDSMNPAANILALATIEVELDEIPEGEYATFKWRGKPVFVKHRTEEEYEKELAQDLMRLRDPQHDADRALKPEWLVVIGICTHLGCIPIAAAGHYGGFYCPCHGSHYDCSGRIRKGPAPLNLEVPLYSFPQENLLLVGK